MRKKLIGKISMDNIHELCFLTQGARNDHRKEELYQLTFDEDERVATNALWIFTHLDENNNKWLFISIPKQVIQQHHPIHHA